MKQLEMLYEGKAKQVFRTDDPDKIIIHYKDAATAFNNIKKATIENKGVLNNAISTLIFKELQKSGVKTHYIEPAMTLRTITSSGMIVTRRHTWSRSLIVSI